jgi:hypothetical protein
VERSLVFVCIMDASADGAMAPISPQSFWSEDITDGEYLFFGLHLATKQSRNERLCLSGAQS